MKCKVCEKKKRNRTATIGTIKFVFGFPALYLFALWLTVSTVPIWRGFLLFLVWFFFRDIINWLNKEVRENG